MASTGQTRCYDIAGSVIDCASQECAGQDAFYQTGCPPEGRFVDNGDGTITDLATGLMWQKADSGMTLNWEEALEYSEELELGGHDDWRLPNVKELQGILDYSRSPATTGT